jgi:ribosomal protein S18 acetylase RimI-like enzyme
MTRISVIEADLSNKEHTDAILKILNTYAKDPMGMNMPLREGVKESLIREMNLFPATVCFLAYEDNREAGLAICFYGFSTFEAKKVLNIHDLAVNPDFRGKGIGKALIQAVEKKARKTDCCKITLEVREDNRARNLYERSGFEYGEPTMYFMTKEL